MLDILLYILLVILCLMAILLLWVIFVPITVNIDTENETYQVVQTGTLRMTFHPLEKNFVEMKVFGIRVPFKTGVEKKRIRKTASQKRTSKPKSKEAWLYLMRGCVRGFRVKKLHMDIDTDDVVLNAQLVPVALLMTTTNYQIRTNVYGRVYLSLTGCAYIYKMVWTIVRFLTKK